MTEPATSAPVSTPPPKASDDLGVDLRFLDPDRGRDVLPPTGSEQLAHIAGEAGPPIIGHTFEFVRDCEAMVARLSRQYGPNIKIRMFGHPVVLLGDPEAVKTVLLDRDKNFSNYLGWAHAIGDLFARGLMLRDFDDHRMHRRIMQVAFRAEAMREYTDRMNPIIERTLERWGKEPRLSFYPSIKQATLDIAADVFLGIPLGNQAEQLNQAFVDSVQASIALIKKEIPGLSYRRGMNGRRHLERFFAGQIPARRQSEASDMFSRMCHAESDEGETFTDKEIVDHMIFLLMAAHDTTTSSLSALVYYLARDQELQERLRQECRALGKDQISWDDKDHPQVLEWAFKEALRLHPPVPFMGRRALRPARVGDLDLPANTGISVCSLITHKLDQYWPDPHRFDPDRFSPERAEDKQHSHVYYPFGGGAHMCLGMHFAYVQVKAFLHQLLLRYRITLEPGTQVEWIPIPIPRPKNGLPVRLETL